MSKFKPGTYSTEITHLLNTIKEGYGMRGIVRLARFTRELMVYEDISSELATDEDAFIFGALKTFHHTCPTDPIEPLSHLLWELNGRYQVYGDE
jgi:hypothetical protein